VKHEVGVCINTGFIVWVCGPHKGGCGNSDIFKDKFEVDAGFEGHGNFKWPASGTCHNQCKHKSMVHRCQENVSIRMLTAGSINFVVQTNHLPLESQEQDNEKAWLEL